MQLNNNICKQLWQDAKHLGIDCVMLAGKPEQPTLVGSGGI